MEEELIELAKKVSKNAYTPYSNFKVGAVLKTKQGKLYTGCNIENHGIMSICAERVAFVKALSEGEREFESITIVANGGTPCGYCRQFMSEFVDKYFSIYIVKDNKQEKYTIQELLPYGFCL